MLNRKTPGRAIGSAASIMALAWAATATGAQAQDAVGDSAPLPAESAATAPADTAIADTDIIVTGSRTITDGANAPTPVTVVSSEQLTVAAPGNLAEAVGQLPAFRGSTRASSAGSAGTTLGASANLLSLRALSPFRTLILLDGRRVVPTQMTGAVDANMIPQGLLKR